MEGGTYMREIKFRAWDERHNCMWQTGQEGESIGAWTFQAYFDPSTRELKTVIYTEDDVGFTQTCTREEKLPLMQYTGLKDKNGKEVYEGDIVRHEVFGIKQITWGSDYDCLKGSLGFMYNTTLAFLHDRDSSEIEVIGNIYETPHNP
jgi:uncharacterized phage protein (TIGR01671 family)